MKASDIKELIAAEMMAIQCAVTDRDPNLFARREQDLVKLHARRESEATRNVDSARAELANREKTRDELAARDERELISFRDAHYNVDAHLERHHVRVAELQKMLVEGCAEDKIAKLAKLKAQIAALEAEMGGAA